MKKTKYRRLAAMSASLLCCLIFTVPAYAQSSEPQPETTPAPVETEAEPETQNPFTPDGTGTVVDNATDEDGKEFYTITTADESVFYLVIDKQKTSENVYFLNTVTTDDLLPLAEQGKEPPKEVTPEPEPKPTEPVEEVPESEPEKKDSPLLSLLLIGAVVLAGGGIGYYFKIYKPKHEAPDLEDDYCEYEDGVPFPVSWTVKMKKKQKETQDILSYHSQAAGCSDKARAKASGGRQPIEECGRTGL